MRIGERRRRRARALAVVVPLAALGAVVQQVDHDRVRPAPVAAGTVAFEQVVVAEGALRPPNPHGKAVGDLDGDGYSDIVVAASSGGAMSWYRERGDRSGWDVHTVRGYGAWGTEMRTADIDADGDLDVVVPDRNALRWYENPRPATPPQNVTSWTEHTIGAEGASNHDVVVGDVNRDGMLDVVSRPKIFRLSVPVLYVWLQTTTGWNRVTVTTELRHKGEGLDLGDVDVDGDLDIVANGYWLENREAGTDWSALHGVDGTYDHPVHENDDPSHQSFVGVATGDVTGDGVPEIVLGSSERYNGYLSVYDSTTPRTAPTGTWRKTTVDTGTSYLHGIRLADVDGDGDLDIVTSESHQATTLHGRPSRVLVYLNPRGTSGGWQRRLLATTGSHNIQVDDFDADGDHDVVGVNWGTDGTGGPAAPDGAKVYLWRNLLIDGPRTDPTTTSSTEESTTTTTSGETTTTSESTTSSESTTTSSESTTTTTESTTTTTESTTTTTASANLAPNPGFEADPTTHYMTHGNGTFTWATDAAWSGQRSLKVSSTQSSTALVRWMSRTTTIAVAPGLTYRANALFKSASVSNKAVLSLQFWGPNLEYLGGASSLKLSGTNPWRLLTVERAAPAGSRYVRVEFRLYGPGTIWVDDVQLTEL